MAALITDKLITLGELKLGLDDLDDKRDAKVAATKANITVSSLSSLPKTVSDSKITDKMKVVEYTLSNPSAQISDWTVTTADGSLTITGTISGTTNLELLLEEF